MGHKGDVAVIVDGDVSCVGVQDIEKGAYAEAFEDVAEEFEVGAHGISEEWSPLWDSNPR